MLANMFVIFRELVSVALLLGVVAGYLNRQHERAGMWGLALGVFVGAMISVLVGIILGGARGVLSQDGREFIIGLWKLVGALLLTNLLFGIIKRRHYLFESGRVASRHRHPGLFLNIVLLTIVMIVPNGAGIMASSGIYRTLQWNDDGTGLLLGLGVVMVIGVLCWGVSSRLSGRALVIWTVAILTFLSAGLLTQGVQQWQEADVLPLIIAPVWNVNPPLHNTGAYPLWHERGLAGSVLRNVIGYDGDPSLLELTAFVGYLLFVLIVWRLTALSRESVNDRA